MHARVRAALLLLVYLCACTPLAALSAAGIAWFDGEHQVRLSMGAEGLSVVLQHDDQQLRVPSSHIHCLVSNALVLLAETPTSSESDHVISFLNSNAGGLASWNERVAPGSPHAITTVLCTRNSPLRLAAASCLPQLLSLPPPETSVHVVRSTVFLI